MRDKNEIKRVILDVLNLVPDDVVSIDVTIRLKGKVDVAELNIEAPVDIVDETSR